MYEARLYPGVFLANDMPWFACQHLHGPRAQTNPSRIVHLQLGTDHRFAGFILASIMVNSVLMALEDYKDPGKLNGNPSIRNQVVSISAEKNCLPRLSRYPFTEASAVANVRKTSIVSQYLCTFMLRSKVHTFRWKAHSSLSTSKLHVCRR